MSRIVILGSGMAALGAAHRLRQENVTSDVYEKNVYPGGHTASFLSDDGFIFDDGPHISFSKNARFRELFAANVDYEFDTFQALVNNYWQGRWIKHPAVCNLHGLPGNLVLDILKDFIDADRQQHTTPPLDYAEWLVRAYGETFARTFPMEYGLKYHTVPADRMETDWLGPRLYRPALEEVLRGALAPATPDVHYITDFRYPRHGGFVAYLNKLIQATRLHLGHRVVRIDPVSKRVRFSNEREVIYDHLISSIPLPELVRMLEGTPQDVLDAASRLACSECVTVNIGIDREEISEAHWTYIYDRDIVFARVSFPHMFASANSPPGMGSIQAEVYFSDKYLPRRGSPESFVELVKTDLERLGLIRQEDNIVHTSARLIRYANVIFDLERSDALAAVHGYLDDVGIRYCGRYGEWAYIWTDQAFFSGEQAAEAVLDQVLTSNSVPVEPK